MTTAGEEDQKAAGAEDSDNNTKVGCTSVDKVHQDSDKELDVNNLETVDIANGVEGEDCSNSDNEDKIEAGEANVKQSEPVTCTSDFRQRFEATDPGDVDLANIDPRYIVTLDRERKARLDRPRQPRKTRMFMGSSGKSNHKYKQPKEKDKISAKCILM